MQNQNSNNITTTNDYFDSSSMISQTFDQIDPCILELALKAVNVKNVRKTLQECSILKSQFDIDPILEPSEDPTCDGPCKCVPFRDCNWSKKMFEKMDILSKNGLAFKTGLRFFKNKVCDYSKRHVYCCNGDQHPSETQVKKLKVMSSQRYPEDIMCSAIDGYTCVSPTNCRQGF